MAFSSIVGLHGLVSLRLQMEAGQQISAEAVLEVVKALLGV